VGKRDLFRAINKGNDQLAKSLVDELAKKDELNLCDEEGNSYLREALIYERYDVADYIIEAGIDVTLMDEEGDDALYSSIIRAPLSIVDKILKRGADINHINKEGISALMLVSMRGNNERIQFLIDRGASVTATKGDQSAISYALEHQFEDTVSLLLSHVSDINDLFLSQDTLYYAAEDRQLYTFIEKNEANLNEANLRKWKAIRLRTLLT
jgi:ankyrin repeat protein